MPWNRLVFILLVISLLTVIVNSKYRGPPDAVKISTVQGFGSFALIEFEVFEQNIKSFKIELHGVRDGKSITKTVEKSPGPFIPTFIESIDNLEPNGTYIVRVFAINEHGQSPPSPDVILSQDENSDEVSECKSPPLLPYKPHVEYLPGSRVNVTWEDLEKRRNRGCQGPIEFIIHYGFNFNMEFATKKTNETWIILDDLKEDAQYYAFVEAKRDNLTSEIHYSFHFSLNEEWTDLPEPDITIESVFKKEVFTPGDPMTVTCSFLPKSNMLHYDMELTVGERVESLNYQSADGVISQLTV